MIPLSGGPITASKVTVEINKINVETLISVIELAMLSFVLRQERYELKGFSFHGLFTRWK